MDAPIYEAEYTIDDIYALPEGQRAELIDGQWYDMATPSLIHQKIVSAIHWKLKDYIYSNGGSCQVLPAPFAVFLNNDNRNYLEPDITVICDEEKLDEDGCHGAPDLVVEVVSPSTKQRDLGIKRFKYRMAGVREYWIINPLTNTITTYSFEDNEEEELVDQITFDEELTSVIFPDFSVVLSEIL